LFCYYIKCFKVFLVCCSECFAVWAVEAQLQFDALDHITAIICCYAVDLCEDAAELCDAHAVTDIMADASDDLCCELLLRDCVDVVYIFPVVVF
jgi:hypothetical protein